MNISNAFVCKAEVDEPAAKSAALSDEVLYHAWQVLNPEGTVGVTIFVDIWVSPPHMHVKSCPEKKRMLICNRGWLATSGNEKITRNDLQRYTSIFFPKLTQADLKTLIKGPGISYEKLKELVKNHELEVGDTDVGWGSVRWFLNCCTVETLAT